jgi:hypothetical protein
MDVGLGSPGMFLLLAGGLAAVAGKALARRDGPAALATGVAAVAAGEGAGLSAHLLAVAWTVVAIGLISAAGSVALRWLLGQKASFTAGLVMFLAVLGGLATQRGAAADDYAAPLTIGRTVQAQLAPLVGWRAIG